MSTSTHHQQPSTPAPQRPERDPLLIVLLALVVALVLGLGLYLCVVHPVLAGPVESMATVGGGLAAVVIATRRR
ncbi:hypothetical protein [Streptomyces sp. NPDC058613]|uniref:hypothetical protein n=1 Tax=unclassified Streptomyces TaxID=2593676 RepID=UPI00365DC29A